MLAVALGVQAVDENLHVRDPVELRFEHRLYAGQSFLDANNPLGISFRRWW